MAHHTINLRETNNTGLLKKTEQYERIHNDNTMNFMVVVILSNNLHAQMGRKFDADSLAVLKKLLRRDVLPQILYIGSRVQIQ